MIHLIAVDPGCSGGFAWTDDDGRTYCEKMPETEGDVLALINRLKIDLGSAATIVYIEDQVGCVGPGMKVAATAMFTFGRGFGFILGAFQALGFPIVLVRPMKWQKALSLGTKRESGGTTPWKNKLKANAQRLYPECDVTLKTADALLLLTYAKQQPHL